MTKPATIELNNDRAFQWLKDGAQPTDTARAILRFKGVMYMKHLQRGVEKGALTQEQADDKLKAWMAEKDAKVQARFDETAAEKKAFYEALAGKTPAKKAPPVAETVAVASETPAEDAAPAEPESETSALDAAVEAVAADPKADEAAE